MIEQFSITFRAWNVPLSLYGLSFSAGIKNVNFYWCPIQIQKHLPSLYLCLCLYLDPYLCLCLCPCRDDGRCDGGHYDGIYYFDDDLGNGNGTCCVQQHYYGSTYMMMLTENHWKVKCDIQIGGLSKNLP